MTAKKIYEIGEIPELGEIPDEMYAWVITEIRGLDPREIG